MTTAPVLEAHYTNGGARKSAILSLAVRVGSQRTFTQEIAVSGRRHANQVAKAYGAIPWNF